MNFRDASMLDPIHNSAESNESTPGEGAGSPCGSIQAAPRRMVPAELLGRHTHVAGNKAAIHVWGRGSSFLARGRLAGQQFGEKLGDTEREAEVRLHEILCEISQGTYIVPSKRHKRQLAQPTSVRLTLRQLIDQFLVEKRQTTGEKTTSDYRARLTPLLEFAENETSRRRWPMAVDLNREFALEFRAALAQRIVHRNGRGASESKLISPGQTYNVLDACRTMLNWARSVQVGKLPSWFANPFSKDIVGQRPQKDPLRKQVYPIDVRIQLVEQMDEWQLTHLAIPLLLPLRPEDYTGLLISDIDYANGWFLFGRRFEGRDFTKGHTSFVCPFPARMEPILRFLTAGRNDGPLLRARSVFEGHRNARRLVDSAHDSAWHIAESLRQADPRHIATPQDQKKLIRSTIREMGGASGDKLSQEFSNIVTKVAQKKLGRFYDLRESVSTDLERAGISLLVKRYVTGHTTNDIMNTYVALEPAVEMKKYFVLAEPLLEALLSRAGQLGLKITNEK